MKLAVLSMLLLFTIRHALSQGTYPLQTGNLWHFHDTYADQFAFSWKAVGDSVFVNGKTYQRLLRQPGYPYTINLRQEGPRVYEYFAHPDAAYEWLRHDFSKGPGDTVSMTPIGDNDTLMNVVFDRGLVQYFGRTLMQWNFSVYFAGNGHLESVVDSLGTTYMLYEGGESVYLRGAIIDGVTYGLIDDVDENEGALEASPLMSRLCQNYPNPFNASTTINLILNTDQHVTLRIYDILGREVRDLLNERLPRGRHTVRWDGKDGVSRDVSSGFYVYRLVAEGLSSSKAMTLLR